MTQLLKGDKGYEPEQTVSKAAHEIARYGFLVKETGWTWHQIQESPEGFVEDMLCFFSAMHRAENEYNEAVMKSSGAGSGSSSGSSSNQNPEITAPKGLNPNILNYRGYEKVELESSQRRTPPPPPGRVVPRFASN